jgi:DNA-binding transcriptional ArsR family regulator
VEQQMMSQTLITQAEHQADLCRVFGNACRLLILWALAGKELPVTEIAIQVGSSMQNVSQHLNLLKRHNLITARRDGHHIYYRIKESPWLSSCPAMMHSEISEITITGGI